MPSSALRLAVSVSLRENVVPATAALSLVSLALVFAAALRAVPPGLLPHAPPAVLAAIPAANAVLSLAAIGTITYGWRAIRRGDVARHRAAMLATVALFGAFLVAYLYRIAVEGPTTFAGPAAVAPFYYALLGVHVLLAVVCIPLVYYVLLLAATHTVAELPRTNHLRVGRLAAALWLVSFALGIVVYLLLYVVY